MRALKQAPEVAAALDAMPVTYIECRDYGHVWQPHMARWLPQDRCYLQTMRCGRCNTGRTRELSITGARLSSGYDYPEGYLMPKGHGYLTADDRDSIRLRSVLSMLDPGGTGGIVHIGSGKGRQAG